MIGWRHARELIKLDKGTKASASLEKIKRIATFAENTDMMKNVLFALCLGAATGLMAQVVPNGEAKCK